MHEERALVARGFMRRTCRFTAESESETSFSALDYPCHAGSVTIKAGSIAYASRPDYYVGFK